MLNNYHLSFWLSLCTLACSSSYASTFHQFVPYEGGRDPACYLSQTLFINSKMSTPISWRAESYTKHRNIYTSSLTKHEWLIMSFSKHYHNGPTNSKLIMPPFGVKRFIPRITKWKSLESPQSLVMVQFASLLQKNSNVDILTHSETRCS